MFTIVRSFVFIAFLGLLASAADITGEWKADLQTPQGVVQVSYVFKQDGEALTGTWQAAQSPTVQISDGKVAGNKISFVVKIEAANMVFAHEGEINREEIRFTMKPSGEFPGSTVTAKKVK